MAVRFNGTMDAWCRSIWYYTSTRSECSCRPIRRGSMSTHQFANVFFIPWATNASLQYRSSDWLIDLTKWKRMEKNEKELLTVFAARRPQCRTARTAMRCYRSARNNNKFVMTGIWNDVNEVTNAMVTARCLLTDLNSIAHGGRPRREITNGIDWDASPQTSIYTTEESLHFHIQTRRKHPVKNDKFVARQPVQFKRAGEAF